MQVINQNTPISFKKGMTLDQYLNEMKTKDPTPNQFQQPTEQEDLYETSRLGEQKFSNKLITYEIRESDEDNYDEQSIISNTQPPQLKSIQKYQSQGKSGEGSTQRSSNRNIINMNAEILEKNTMRNSKGFRVRNHSNSPYNIKKKQFSPKINKTLIRSLYNSQWKQYKESQRSPQKFPQGATLYGSFFKGLSQKTNDKHFKKKNSRQIDNLMKYERELNMKYFQGTRSEFKIEGISDKLHQRKGKFIK